ncbi:MAG: ketoacyl-ACP synthase III [Clostridium sp.]|nr:ketoacyl-ACP synthase III [Clostridium sp.]
MNVVKIIGTGSYVPKRSVKNDELAQIVDTSDEWIYSRTGIKQRRISIEEDTSVLASKAALEAIKDSKIDPLKIDMIILATTSPDNFTPSTACLVQGIIGADNATCFDISAACTGFIYCLDIATQFIKSGQAKTILVIGAEVLSKIIDWSDRSTCILFGDGAGAAILETSEEEGVMEIYTGSKGKDARFLKCPAIEVNNFLTDTNEARKSVLSMDGKEIFKFATQVMPKSINKVLKNASLDINDIDCIIPHQANVRIIDFVAKKLDINKEKFYINLDKYGNTSAASISIALDEMSKEGLLKKGDKIILVGFGAGLTFGAVLIKWLI